MSNQKEKTTAQAAGMNRAKPYQLVLFPMNNGATNVYLYSYHEFYRILCKRSVRTCAYVCNDNGNRYASF